ncbi:nitroreductase family protein [Ancylomarina sp. 16SWW S1-10-2]|uniref:nitroreductase family protein n=1 Tax=Ancylomarina sp. 16SWW S1-10-2 TaxID=2499681 RepID=UPI0012AD32C0|nr:nitroreductase family protein [Ancylomarina sp. 16SWW S1-10-2]MRT91397.1 nitroreductase family protein [Ancylomarina sp. 16SWW S1-10-2]
MLKELVLKNRSYRRFYQNEIIGNEQLKQWIDLARLGASGRNAQSIRYLTVTNQELCKQVFDNLAWAGYLSDWAGPIEGEQPVAYVIMLNDERLSKNYFSDDGIAVQNLLLGAVEAGYGGCILRAFKEKNLRELLHISEDYLLIQVVALGKPKEKVVIEEMKDENIKYWRDENGVHHVPKRKLEDLVIAKL